jgi:hypothetical protein
MNPAVESVVRFDDEAAPQCALYPGVELVRLGYANRRVESAREVSEPRAERPDEWRVRVERIGEVKVRGDERAALGWRKVVRVELYDGTSEREVVNRERF